MICSVIKRRLQKVPLSRQYKQQFSEALEKVQQKYQQQSLNKSLMIKNICKRYLKICNKLANDSNIEHSLAALEFVKLLQLDIYEGKSYELYPIKITSHLLFVKCFDLKIAQKKGTPEVHEIRRRKRVYVERLKMFVQQIEESFFYEFLQKDYYSNLQHIMFIILRNELEKLLENNTNYVTTTQSILIQLTFIKKYLLKLFELLKSHILQLNEMLFYLENKVYELLTVKVKLMIQLFHIETQIHFIEHIGEKFSDKEWLLYKRFLEECEQNDRLDDTRLHESRKTNKNLLEDKKKPEIALKTFKIIAHKNYSQDRSLIEQEGGNYQNLSYEAMKAKFFSEQIDLIWQKYDGVLNKIPNSIDQEQIFEQVYSIINSFKEKAQQKETKIVTLKSIIGKRRNEEPHLKDLSQDSEQGDEIKSDNDQNLKDQRVKKKRDARTSSIYKQRKNSELNDFMSFVKNSQTQQICLSRFNQEKQNHLDNANQFESQQSNVREHSSFISQKFSNDSIKKPNPNILDNQNQNEQENNQHRFQKQRFPSKPFGKDQVKRSNFKMIKDMKNIFDFICDKNHQNKSSQNIGPIQSGDKVQFKSLLKNGKQIIQNQPQIFISQGFKKLHDIKTPTIKILENIKTNQFERLRRIKSTDILGTNTIKTNEISKKWSNEKGEKIRSKTLYFPFILKQEQEKKKRQAPIKLDLPKIVSATNSKLLITKNLKKPSKGPLTIKQRDEAKKTTLDVMEMNRFLSKNSDVNITELRRQNVLELNNCGAKEENQEKKHRQQFDSNSLASMDKEEEPKQRLIERGIILRKTHSGTEQ